MAHICTPSSVTYGDTFPLEGEGFRMFCESWKRSSTFCKLRFLGKTKEVCTIAFPFEGEGGAVGDG